MAITAHNTSHVLNVTLRYNCLHHRRHLSLSCAHFVSVLELPGGLYTRASADKRARWVSRILCFFLFLFLSQLPRLCIVYIPRQYADHLFRYIHIPHSLFSKLYIIVKKWNNCNNYISNKIPIIIIVVMKIAHGREWGGGGAGDALIESRSMPIVARYIASEGAELCMGDPLRLVSGWVTRQRALCVWNV